jgi:molybdopterin converting factor small subunit
LREESTRIKEVATTKKEELTEMISTSTKIVDKLTKEIITQKEKITELRTKEKEITTKITTSSETTDIESLKKELNQVTS